MQGKFEKPIGEYMYKVFVVDDDPLILDEIVNTVPWLDNGFEVIGHSVSPQTALFKIRVLQPDVLFCDLKMPELNGIELMETLFNEGVKCRCVMLSAFPSFEDSRKFFRLNGFDYLLKPLQQQEVQLVLERLSAHLSSIKAMESIEIGAVSPAFAEMIAFLDRNFDKKHTLESLGKQFGLSANYICNLFAKHYNITLTRYITDLRMKKAVQLMQIPDVAFKQVAIECGYGDYYYFCKVFKDFYGDSPSKYAKKWATGN